MGEMPPSHLIPLSDAAKEKGDVAAIATAFFAFFKVIPWPEIAAFAACVYTLLRIGELVWSWVRKKRRR
jgi:hypothetical protein